MSLNHFGWLLTKVPTLKHAVFVQQVSKRFISDVFSDTI